MVHVALDGSTTRNVIIHVNIIPLILIFISPKINSTLPKPLVITFTGMLYGVELKNLRKTVANDRVSIARPFSRYNGMRTCSKLSFDSPASVRLYLWLTVLSYIQLSIISVNSSPLYSFSKFSPDPLSNIRQIIETSRPFVTKSSKWSLELEQKLSILATTASCNSSGISADSDGEPVPWAAATCLLVYASIPLNVYVIDF